MSLIIEPNTRWSFVNNCPLSWGRLFVEKIAQAELPSLTGPWLYVSSDYSGASRDSRYSVICFLIADMENSRSWETQRRIVRSDYMGDGRRMAFKALNDKQRRGALVPFLSAADEICGLCIAIVIDKRIRPLLIDKALFEHPEFIKRLEGKWNLHALENMFRVVHFYSLIIAGLSQPEQDIYWVSDNDDFFATPSRTRDTQHVLGLFTSLYIHHKTGKLGMGTTDIDEGDRGDEDLAAIPDLVAGSLAETMTAMLKHYGQIPPLPTILETRGSRKADLINSWFFSSKSKLKKVACLFDYKAQNHFRVGTFSVE